MKTQQQKIDAIKEYIQDILQCEEYMQVEKYNHHFKTNIFEHCVDVAYLSFRITKLLGLDYRSTVRASMLHDFFLYNWQTTMPKEGLHGFVHARIAYENASRNFDLNKKEKDIILKHMFPLNIMPPRYLESYVVTMVDKFCAFEEVAIYIYNMIAVWVIIMKKEIKYSEFLFSLIYISLIVKN